MQTKFLEERIDYTGAQLRSHWIYENFGILGDAMVSFIGGCRVNFSEMVDLEDVVSSSPIRGDLMLHFIVEHFDTDLEKAILRQRLLMATIADLLNEQLSARRFVRSGDDIFDGDGKLSISIATVSPVSSLIHVGLNISTEGTPVKTVGLSEYGIDPESFARLAMNSYADEITAVEIARAKVRWVS